LIVSTFSVDLPESLHAAADELARESGVTVEQFMASALAEKISAVAGPGWLAGRAARGDRARFEEALGRVADVEPEGCDRL
jgi:post-segregation antitoxin (ccd killing protein)